MTTTEEALTAAVAGLDASRRAGWARAYAAEARIEELEQELTELKRAHPMVANTQPAHVHAEIEPSGDDRRLDRDRRMRRIADYITKLVEREAVSHGELRRRLATRDRPWMDEAIWALVVTHRARWRDGILEPC